MNRLYTFVLLATAACGNVLGYDDVTFDSPRGSSQENAPVGATNGGSASSFGAGASSSDGGNMTLTNDAGPAPSPPVTNPGPTPPAPNPAALTINFVPTDACDAWRKGRTTTTAGTAWSAGASTCDPGTLTDAAVRDTLTRIAMYRYFVGLPAVGETVSERSTYMACAAVASWYPPSSGNPHAPPATATCYTPQGAAGAGSANIGWGGFAPADAIDQYAEDYGNEATFGHRRWILNPALGNVGIGFYAGGGPYGSAQCLGIRDSSGAGPAPEWFAFPMGPVPVEITRWAWTVHHRNGSAAIASVQRTSDGASLSTTATPLGVGYGGYAVTAFRPDGWTPDVGDSYTVTVDGIGPSPIVYSVSPLQC